MENEYDIIILAGQSNAEGNGMHERDKEMFSPENAWELTDKNPAWIKDDNGKAVLILTSPTEMQISRLKERRAGEQLAADISITFAKRYCESDLSSGRKLLVVKAAVGGSGFAKEQWGKGSVLYNRLVEMLDYAVKLGGEVKAMLWHQGEHDAFENAGFNYDERYDFYYNKLIEQFTALRTRYGEFPIITGEFVNDWADKNQPQCSAVENATKAVCEKIGNAAMVSSEGLYSNDQAIENGDDIHFCAESVYELGERYYKAFKEITK